MNSKAKIFTLCAVVILLAGCSSVTGPTLSGNLIINPSFELSNMPTIAGWDCNDTTLIAFSQDTPSNGGLYSLAISPGPIKAGNDSIEGSVYTTVAAIAGTHQYKLTVWAKADNWEGDAYLDILKFNPPALPIFIESPDIDSPIWQQYSMTTDPVTTNPGDSITIGLEVGSTNSTGGKVYFDLCTFEAVN